MTVLESYLRTSHIPFRHLLENNTHRYVVEHRMGSKFGMYLTATFSSLFGDAGCKITDIKNGENSSIFEIDGKSLRQSSITR